jgi:hypothetical protein
VCVGASPLDNASVCGPLALTHPPTPTHRPPNPKNTRSMGEWLVKLLTELQYYGTMLPRIPVPIERKIKVRLSLFLCAGVCV